MIFETNRLVIKKLSLIHLEGFHELHGDPEVMELIPAPTRSFEESRAQLSSIIQAYEVQEHRLRVWGVFLQGTGYFVGVCAAIRLSGQGRDIGYRMLRKYWGQGLGTEVANGLIDYLRADRAVKYLTASVDVQNLASIKILERSMNYLSEEYVADAQRYERHYKLIL